MNLAALDAGVVGRADRLDPLHEQPGHARGHVEAMRVGLVDLDQRQAELDRARHARGRARLATVGARRRRSTRPGRSASFTVTSIGAAVAQQLEPRRRSRLACGDLADQLVVGRAPAGRRRRRSGRRACMPGALARRARGHVLHQRAVARASASATPAGRDRRRAAPRRCSRATRGPAPSAAAGSRAPG